MRRLSALGMSVLLGIAANATAEGLTRDAAIGGAIGGALGGAVGAELGGRQGAIVGAGVGAATGAALNTQEYAQPPRHDVYYYNGGDGGHPAGVPHQNGGFCPPGQAKKGRC